MCTICSSCHVFTFNNKPDFATPQPACVLGGKKPLYVALWQEALLQVRSEDGSGRKGKARKAYFGKKATRKTTDIKETAGTPEQSNGLRRSKRIASKK